MSISLTISIPDLVLARLQERAVAEGTSPEVIAAIELATPKRPEGYGKIRRLAGTLTYSEPDVATRHHEILGDALADELLRRDAEMEADPTIGLTWQQIRDHAEAVR